MSVKKGVWQRIGKRYRGGKHKFVAHGKKEFGGGLGCPSTPSTAREKSQDLK